jgi:type II secretory pathway component PulK
MTTPSPTRSYQPPYIARPGEAGVALILIMFVVALATIIVVELAYSSYIGGRLNRGAQRSLQAEYLLRSTLNLAQILLKVDNTIGDRPFPEDAWAQFGPKISKEEKKIPPDLLGIQEPNLKLFLEISPTDGKFNLISLRTGGDSYRDFRDILHRLFKHPALDFDNDGELDLTDRVARKEFGAADMVANLIDFLDRDTDSYDEGDFQGIEAQLAPGDAFPNNDKIQVEQLRSIPGFTPLRVQRLLPFVTDQGEGNYINVNHAPPELLESIHPDLTKSKVESIIDNRERSGPFADLSELEDVIGSISTFRSRLTTGLANRMFQVIAIADYGTSVYYLRAYVKRTRLGQGWSLHVHSMEFF